MYLIQMLIKNLETFDHLQPMIVSTICLKTDSRKWLSLRDRVSTSEFSDVKKLDNLGSNTDVYLLHGIIYGVTTKYDGRLFK